MKTHADLVTALKDVDVLLDACLTSTEHGVELLGPTVREVRECSTKVKAILGEIVCPDTDGNQQGSGLRGDPVADGGQIDPTRDKGSESSDLGLVPVEKSTEEKTEDLARRRTLP